MRRIIALIGLAAAFLFVGNRNGVTESAPPATYDIAFHEQGVSGELGIRFAFGKMYVARDLSGTVVSYGHVQSNDWIVPVTLTQPGGLWVTIEGVTSFVDRDCWWL